MKKVISLLLSVIMCFTLSVPASAKTGSSGTAQPYYDKASTATSKLTVSGTVATCKSSCDGKSNVVKIVAMQTLEKDGRIYDNTAWLTTVNSSTLTMSNTKSGLVSGKYRLKTVFTLTDTYGMTETFTVYSDEKTV